MHKRTIALVVASAILLTGCARPMNICGTIYESYGLLNADNKQNPEVQYEIVWGNVFWGVVLVETVIVPLYFFGFSIFEPVGQKPAIKGAKPTHPPVCEKAARS